MVIRFICLLLHFVRFLKEHVNIMPLQESEEVNETLEVDQMFRFT